MGQALLIKREKINDSTYLLNFKSKEKLNFIGGQFLIIDTGIIKEDGKSLKRTYSILSEDSDQFNFQIAYKTIVQGIVTNQYLNFLKIEDEIKFSGPWGKFLKDDQFLGEGKICVLATDTGVASAISFINSNQIPDKSKISFYWMVPDNSYFLDYQFVKNRLPKNLNDLEIIEKPKFLNMAIEILTKHTKARSFLLSGDGDIVKPSKDFLLNQGVLEPHIGTEIYFNK